LEKDEEEEKKSETEDHQQDTSTKGATGSEVEEGKAQDGAEKSGNATTGILRTARGSVVADLAADDSHPEADDVEPLPPKTLFHSSVEGRNNKTEKSPSGIMKDSSVGPTKRERHVGFEADSKLPATSGTSSHPPPHSYYEQAHHHGIGRPTSSYSLPPPLPSYPPYHHHQPPHSYGGHPAGLGHGMGVDLHHPSPPPPVHSPYYAEYRPHSTGEYRPAASLRRAEDEKPAGNSQQEQKGCLEAASAQAAADEGEKEKEETSSASFGADSASAKNADDRKERGGEANQTPMQHHQQVQANPNSLDASASPYAPFDAYAPFGRYQPPPSGMRIGGGPGNRHYDHSPLDANPDRQKPRAESYEIDPRDPRAAAGVRTPHNPSLEAGYGPGHGHNPPVTPHGFLPHHQEGPFDVRGGMDRLVATPASGGFVSSIRGR